MDFNIDLVSAMKYYKEGKISKFALEAKLVDHASNMSPLDRVDVEITEGQEKGFVILFVPKVYGDKQVSLYMVVNNNAFELFSCETLAKIFSLQVDQLFDEGGRLYNWHKENKESELDLEDIVELYRDLTISSNKYVSEIDPEIYASLIDSKYMFSPDELDDRLDSLVDSGDRPYEVLEQIESAVLLPSYYMELIKEDIIRYGIAKIEDQVKEEQIEDGEHPAVNVATNAIIDVSDSDDENVSEQLEHDYTPTTNQ